MQKLWKMGQILALQSIFVFRFSCNDTVKYFWMTLTDFYLECKIFQKCPCDRTVWFSQSFCFIERQILKALRATISKTVSWPRVTLDIFSFKGRFHANLLPYLQKIYGNIYISVALFFSFYTPAPISKISFDRFTRHLARMCLPVFIQAKATTVIISG